MRRSRRDLTTPHRGRRVQLGLFYDPDAFGRFSEAIARYLGTARYLVFQSVVVVGWIALNAVAWELQWDEYPFILLTLALSMQASYAAPLILLAQNRQAERDREASELDREVNARTQADTEFLAREVASIRFAMSDIVTTDDLDERLDTLVKAVNRLTARLDVLDEPSPS